MYLVTKSIKTEKDASNKKMMLNLDTQCGVILENGLACTRSITCKIHPISSKRAVVGRSQSYDLLHQESMARTLLSKKGNIENDKILNQIDKDGKSSKYLRQATITSAKAASPSLERSLPTSYKPILG